MTDEIHGIVSPSEIGMIIKRRRKELEMSQEKLASILNVTYQQVQRYEKGINKLTTDKLQIIAKALQIPITYLFKKEKYLLLPEPRPHYLYNEEEKLVSFFRRINKKRCKKCVLRFLNSLNSKKN